MIFLAKGQENIIANYTMVYKKDSTRDTTTKKDFVLYISPYLRSSIFCSYDKFKYDSLKVAEVENVLSPSKNFDFDFMIKKNYNINSVSRFEKQLNKLFVIDLVPDFKWKITDEKKNIDVYTVQKAVLSFKGRIWEAWFTSQIPVSDGPYIFSGLPGLILEMKDKNENYLFSCTMIKKNNINFSPIMSLKPIIVTQKQLNKVRLDYYNDPFREMKSNDTKVTWTDENGKKFSPNYREMTKDAQDALKRFNNPVDLSDATNYK